MLGDVHLREMRIESRCHCTRWVGSIADSPYLVVKETLKSLPLGGGKVCWLTCCHLFVTRLATSFSRHVPLIQGICSGPISIERHQNVGAFSCVAS